MFDEPSFPTILCRGTPLNPLDSGGARSHIPTAMLDAGDAAWSALSALVAQRMADLPLSGVLEITFLNPEVRLPLVDWCHTAGHDLFDMSVDGHQTWLWIKKR